MAKQKQKSRRGKSQRARVTVTGQDLWVHGYGRAALARMMKIHRLIEDRTYPNCRKMSEEFEMSVRTLKRDIEFMRNRLKMPIEFDVPKNGYYFTRSVPHFPTVPLSEREMVWLFLAQKGIEQYRGSSIHSVLETAFSKMTAGLDDSVKFSMGNLDEVISIRPFGPGDAELETFELLTRAIRERKVVEFVYRKHGELTTTKRRVHPYHIRYVRNLWTLFAFDPKARAVRKFVMFRIAGPRLTDEKYVAPPKFDADEHLSGSMGLFKGEENHEVVVEFDRWGADDVRGRRWHSSQEFTNHPDGSLTLKMELDSLEEVEGWVLSFGTHAKVIGPQKLRERLFRVSMEIFQKYGGPMMLAGPDEG
jgi:proteasome accessory factor B